MTITPDEVFHSISHGASGSGTVRINDAPAVVG
jgi:hypothetical protein